MRFFKWLHPGLHIKRWLFLFGLGMMCTSFGIVLTFNYQWIGGRMDVPSALRSDGPL